MVYIGIFSFFLSMLGMLTWWKEVNLCTSVPRASVCYMEALLVELNPTGALTLVKMTKTLQEKTLTPDGGLLDDDDILVGLGTAAKDAISDES
jgi:hypothetical protein